VPATQRALDLAKVAALAAEDKLATTITAIDVSEQLALTDVFVIVSASTDRQVGAIVDEVEDKLRETGAKPVRREA
jgi:ribosome-associated protein